MPAHSSNEYQREYLRKYRLRKKREKEQKSLSNRHKFLEFEVERLNHCLEFMLSNVKSE
jgi:hypothetical protein